MLIIFIWISIHLKENRIKPTVFLMVHQELKENTWYQYGGIYTWNVQDLLKMPFRNVDGIGRSQKNVNYHIYYCRCNTLVSLRLLGNIHYSLHKEYVSNKKEILLIYVINTVGNVFIDNTSVEKLRFWEYSSQFQSICCLFLSIWTNLFFIVLFNGVLLKNYFLFVKIMQDIFYKRHFSNLKRQNGTRCIQFLIWFYPWILVRWVIYTNKFYWIVP